jgi:hypothetical protein
LEKRGFRIPQHNLHGRQLVQCGVRQLLRRTVLPLGLAHSEASDRHHPPLFAIIAGLLHERERVVPMDSHCIQRMNEVLQEVLAIVAHDN